MSAAPGVPHSAPSGNAPYRGRLPRAPLDPVDARRLVGLAGLPTIVAVGPFDDQAHALNLASAYIVVRRQSQAQLILLGTGAHRATIKLQALQHGAGSSVHLVPSSSDDRWADYVAAADLVVLEPRSTESALLNVMTLGRPVVAAAGPASAELVVPAIAGLIYPPGDVAALAAALLRLLSTPVLRRGMGGRAMNVARRHLLQSGTDPRTQFGPPTKPR